MILVEQDKGVFEHMKKPRRQGRTTATDDILTAGQSGRSSKPMSFPSVPFARRIQSSTTQNRRTRACLRPRSCHVRLFFLQRDRDGDGR